jgi:hypothetical protein
MESVAAIERRSNISSECRIARTTESRLDLPKRYLDRWLRTARYAGSWSAATGTCHPMPISELDDNDAFALGSTRSWSLISILCLTTCIRPSRFWILRMRVQNLDPKTDEGPSLTGNLGLDNGMERDGIRLASSECALHNGRFRRAADRCSCPAAGRKPTGRARR